MNTSAEQRIARSWPLVVRRARAEDEQRVLSFATKTWNDWDYVPHAWPRWLEEKDGVMLVGVVGSTDAARGAVAADGARRPVGADGAPGPVAADGAPLEVGSVIAVVRVAMPATGEAWLEAIRIDPRVRGMEVATDLQVAELHWAAAQGATIVRYATSARNEGSHRLGARGGFELLARFLNTHWQPETANSGDEHGSSGFLREVQADARARRRRLLDALTSEGAVARESDVAQLWSALWSDATFIGGARLYEPRPWALEALTEEKFAEHARLGEVLVHNNGGRAVAILVADVAPAEDSAIRLAVLDGAPRAAFELVEQARRLAREPITFRYPVGAPLVNDVTQLYRERGYDLSDWELHIFARPVDDTHPLPPIDPAVLVLEEIPQAIVIPARA